MNLFLEEKVEVFLRIGIIDQIYVGISYFFFISVYFNLVSEVIFFSISERVCGSFSQETPRECFGGTQLVAFGNFLPKS